MEQELKAYYNEDLDKLTISRFEKKFPLADTGFFLNFLIAYILAFVSLYPKYGISIVAFSPLLVVAAAWFWGTKGGIITGLLSFPVYAVLSYLMGTESWSTNFWFAGFVTVSSSTLLGAWVGLICDMGDKLKHKTIKEMNARSELEKTNRELMQLKNQLEQKVGNALQEIRDKDHLMIQQSRQAAMGEMMSNIAHQWRQPLTAVGAIIQSFEDAYEDNELTAEYLEDKIEMVMDILQHMSQTIDDFRNFFKPDKLEEEFNLSENIQSTVKLVQSSFKHNKINLNLELGEESIIRGFPNEFSQVILIILNNSKDALLENKTKNPQVTIELDKSETANLIKIRDNGGGILQNKIYNIFEPYFTTKEEGKGTGLGLYMSKMIIEKNMGGKLDVRNTEDGAEFIISL